ncbi:DUF4365 domain-containing protein [Flagellimonas sp. 389]|uniref:DUF4365 domain-containing protein n=1 Tax=Flagellimonas sp. 389 TaxID=2835862 RepID=UPI001BD39D79|nr:DUF4365 domain-containing protein [Flagellimonas sp. 389]MBS9462503.1 DUF4365 domain-containing protein [Flagellimonas sp. 389]
MIRDTRPQDSTGMSVSEIITQGKAKHGWQPYSHINDNGVDAMIIFRKKAIDTGEIMFAQVKCGTGSGYFKKTKKRPVHFGVNVGEDYIKKHREKWDRLSSPIILIYVDYYTQKAWWTDLKDEKSYSDENRSIILVPKNQRFGKHSFGEFKNLKGRIFVSKEIEFLDTKNEDFSYLKLEDSIKTNAKKFYLEWSKSDVSERSHPQLGEIIISRVGWRHLTRNDRKINRIVNSFSLLGVAKKIITTTNKCYQIKQLKVELKDGTHLITDYLALKRKVIFPFRQDSLIQVILKRKRKLNPKKGTIDSKTWFYSVYEPLSKKNIH